MNYLNKNKSALVDRVKSPARCPEEDYKLGLSQSFASHRPSGTRSLTMGVLPSHVDLLAGTANPGQGKKKAKPPAPPSTRRLGGLAKPPTLPRRDGTGLTQLATEQTPSTAPMVCHHNSRPSAPISPRAGATTSASSSGSPSRRPRALTTAAVVVVVVVVVSLAVGSPQHRADWPPATAGRRRSIGKGRSSKEPMKWLQPKQRKRKRAGDGDVMVT